MLVVTRKLHETITISPGELGSAAATEHALAGGEITIKVHDIGSNRVRLLIEAPPHFRVWRGRATALPDPQPSGRHHEQVESDCNLELGGTDLDDRTTGT